MKWLPIILGLIIVVSSCSQKVLPTASTDIKDSVRIEYREIVRDTTIYVPVPTESEVRETPDTTSYVSTSLAESWAEWSSGKLRHSINNRKDINLPVDIQYKEIVRDTTIIKVTTIKEPYAVEKNLTKWQQFKMTIGGWALGAAVLLLLFALRKLVL